MEGQPSIHGLLLVDKPGGMTSHHVVARVRRIVGTKSVGHLGTLDPMATGLLPLVLGNFTRLAQFFGSMEKQYTGAIQFGWATDTYDAEGAPTGPAAPVGFKQEQLVAAAAQFEGELDQMPPPYSAKKIDGKPAYMLARKGETPRLRTARVRVAEFVITAYSGETAEFRMCISSGGYVRSVAHELGQALGCGAHLARLRRTAAGPFSVDAALTLPALEGVLAAGSLKAAMPHPRTLLPEFPSVTVDAQTLVRLRHGAQINLPEYSRAEYAKVFADQRELAAIARRLAGTLFQPTIVLS